MWVFDLMYLDGQYLTGVPLSECRLHLEQLMRRVPKDGVLRLSETFEEPIELLAAAERMGLEGIVSKRRNSPYLSGPTRSWLKVKTAAWREANRDRGEMFRKTSARTK